MFVQDSTSGYGIFAENMTENDIDDTIAVEGKLIISNPEDFGMKKAKQLDGKWPVLPCFGLISPFLFHYNS